MEYPLCSVDLVPCSDGGVKKVCNDSGGEGGPKLLLAHELIQ